MNVEPKAPVLAAALAGWLLSGSPVPMALTLALLLAALVGGALLPRRRTASAIRQLVPLLFAGTAAWLEIRLFLDGRALAMRAELPLAYHLGLAVLWWTALDPFLRAPGESEVRRLVHAYAGLVGGILVLGASAGTTLQNFGPWLVHPVAALPFALWATRLLLPTTPFARLAACVALPACLALAGLVLASSAAADALRSLFPEKTAVSDAPSLRAPQPDGSGTLGEGSSRRLPREADVRFRHEILVLVRPHSDALFRSWSDRTLYLRTSTLALFENDEVLSPIRSGRWLYEQDDGTEDHRLLLRGANPDDATDPATLHTLYISRDTAGQLPLVGGSQALFLASVYEFADDWFQLSPAEGIDRLSYTASAPPSPVAEIRSADLIRPPRGTASGIYLQLPPSPLPSRVDLLCREIDDDDLLDGIRSLLDERTRYSLQFQTPEGSSPIAEFLFGHGLGHCEHYAAATVLMLRCLGIPSRVAYGYAGGLVDADQGVFAFRDSDFHAWAEILTAENEWRIFDTTPRVASAAPRPSVAASLPTIDVEAYHDLSDFDPATLAAAGSAGAYLADAVDFLSRHFFLATAVGLALFGCLWWILPGNPKDREAYPQSGSRLATEAKPPFPDFLHELEQSAQALGLHRRPGQTWRELLARLSERGTVPAAVHDAVAYHYHTAYAGKERDPAEEARFREALRDWRETELH